MNPAVSRTRVAGFAAMLAVLFTTSAFAQLDSGTISGTVLDPTGAVIPNVKVVLINELTAATRETATSDAGTFIFQLIQAGRYRMQVEQTGFKRYERQNLVLQVNQQLTVPVRLEMGTTADSVLVSSEPPAVDIVSGALRETIDAVKISELPLNGRNVLQLINLLPGTVPMWAVDFDAATVAVNGGNTASNHYSLDGAEYQDAYKSGALPFPNPDAIAEFAVETNAYGAENGHSRSAAINAVTKSGTNQLHGSLFEFWRNEALDARPFFGAFAPKFRRNQFGASIGGPVIKDKTFFFFSWQSTRQLGATNVSTIRVPDAKLRSGDFSAVATPILDPATKQPFANNVIPASMLDPTTKAFMEKYVPLPNRGDLYVYSSAYPNDTDQYLVRVDHNLTTRDRLYGRFVATNLHTFRGSGNLPDFGADVNYKRPSAMASYTRTFSPTIVNVFTATWNRNDENQVPAPTFAWSTLGAKIPDAAPGIYGWFALTATGYFSVQNSSAWVPTRNSYLFYDTLSWQRGAHTILAGAQITRYTLDQLNEFYTRGNFTFDGSASGMGLADMMLGRVASMQLTSPLTNHIRTNLWHFFVQDNWKVNRRLSFNFGVRWEPEFPFTEQDGKKLLFIPGAQSTRFPDAPRGLIYQGDPQAPAGVTKRYLAQFAPRFSFAYDLFGDGTTSIRGGWGLFFDQVRMLTWNRFPMNQPFLLDQTFYGVNFTNPFPNGSLFPFTAPANQEEAKKFPFVTPAGATVFQGDWQPPYSQQWNLNIQRQLPKQTVITVAYVGSKNDHVTVSRNINPAVWRADATATNIQARRIYPEHGRIEEEATIGYSQHHAFQLTVNRRYAKGLTILGTYTVGKTTGLTASWTEGSQGTRDPFNLALDKAVLNWDRAQVLNISGVWEIPFRTGNKFANAIAGGWQLTGIYSAMTGTPLTVRSPVQMSLNDRFLDTADLVGSTHIDNNSRADELAHWFNPAAFAIPQRGSVGTAGINIIRAPGAQNLDVGLYRNITLTERFKLQFRAEFFNSLNHTTLGVPGATAATPGVTGRITTTGSPRVGELGLKLSF